MNAFGVDDDRFSKAQYEPSSGKPSAGRRATNAAFGVYHVGATSRKGHRAKNIGADVGYGLAGAAPGAAIYALAPIRQWNDTFGERKVIRGNGLRAAGLATAVGGGVAARQIHLSRMNRKGTLKAEED